MTRPKVWGLLAVLALPSWCLAQAAEIALPSPDGADGGVRPQLSINSIEQGSAVKGELPIDVTLKPATDGVPLAKCDVMVDGQPVAMFDLANGQRSVTFNWDTREASDGKHTVEAVVQDKDGRMRTYSTYVYVRNLGRAPAPPQLGPAKSTVEITDSGGAPSGVITKSAVIRVVPDASLGVKWVIIHVNGAMRAMMNRPPFTDTFKPKASLPVGDPIIVNVRVIRPDDTEEDLGPYELKYDPSYSRAKPPVSDLPAVPAANVPRLPGVAAPLDAPGTTGGRAADPARSGAPASTVSGAPLVTRIGSVDAAPALPGSAGLAPATTAPAVPLPPLPAAPVTIRPAAVTPPRGGAFETLPAARLGVGGAVPEAAASATAPVAALPGHISDGRVTLPGTQTGGEAALTTSAKPYATDVTSVPVAGTAPGNVAASGPTVGVPTVARPAVMGPMPAAERHAATTGVVSSRVAASVVSTRLAGPVAGQPSLEGAPRVSVPSTGVKAEPAVSRAAVGPVVAKIYVVAKGDTLSALSRKFHVSGEDLQRLNQLSPTRPMKIGQRLVIPSGNLMVNGAQVHTDVAPLQHQGGISTSPLRFVVEGLGGSVSWIGPAKQVKADTGRRGMLTITIGSREATLGNERILMDLAAYLEGDRTMVPARFISQALDVTIDMDPDSGNIVIRSNN